MSPAGTTSPPGTASPRWTASRSTADRRRVSPRIGRSLALQPAAIGFEPVFAYWSVTSAATEAKEDAQKVRGGRC
jgi:hypothetical protein